MVRSLRLAETTEEDLPEEDGVPLESDWHRLAMNVLIESICYRFRDRQDFYAGGNMFIYYRKKQPRQNVLGPDFFYVSGVPKEPVRRYWAVWREQNRFPNVIIEFMSPTTTLADLTTKKDIYEEVFRTPDYFCYDPDEQKLTGWRLANKRYQPLAPNEQGRLWSEELQLWLGTARGDVSGRTELWLRFFDEKGQIVPLFFEAERLLRKKQAQRARKEKQRADAAEKEIARLRAKIAEQKKNGGV